MNKGQLIRSPHGHSRAASPARQRRVPAIGVGAIPQTPLLDQLLFVGVIALLAAPAVTPLAALARWTFPGLTALVAGWLFLRNRPDRYLTFCLWLFLLTPFVRRLVDLHAGYAKANVLMLAPYIAMGWSSLQAPRFFMSERSRVQAPMFGLLLTIFYGFLLAIAYGRLLAGLVGLVRWAVPPLFACYLLVNGGYWEAITRQLKALALVGLPVISLYGVYQYVAPPLWDVNWMLSNPGILGYMGYPAPFQIRVFGSLNSPASLAFYLVALSFVCLATRSPLRWVSIATAGMALALTITRTAWLTFALGLALMFVLGPNRMRTSLLALAAGALMLGPLALTNSRMEQTVADRFDTFSTMGTDSSFNARGGNYLAFIDEISAHPFGSGLGISDSSSSFSDTARSVDGGPIDILLSFGIVGGGLYTGMIFTILLSVIVRARETVDLDLQAALGAIALTQAVGLSSTTTVVGEIGVLFWLAAALALCAPSRAPFRLDSPASIDAPPRPAGATRRNGGRQHSSRPREAF